MELVLKMPPGKPPFIGILFESEHKAAQTNASWVNNNHSLIYRLILEPVNGVINLRLIQDELGCNCLYSRLKNDPEQLLKFLYQTREIYSFNFGHVYWFGDNLKLAKSVTNQRNFVLKVEAVKVLIEY